MAGPLALVGGDELHPGNEPQDRLLVEAAGGGPGYVVATAAARQRPELAVAHARSWFGALGLDVEELPVRTRPQARSAELAERAAGGTFFYLVGGDPGLVADVLRGSAVWEAIGSAWRGGAALAGSSAGAMAMAAWTLTRRRVRGDRTRVYRDALSLVP
jgi:cyanophycinase